VHYRATENKKIKEKMKKKAICVTLLLISSLSFSRSIKGDYLVKEEKTLFFANVGLSGKRVEFIKENEKSSSTKNVYNFLDVNISDLSVIENPLELKSNNLKKDMLIYR
jgi:hypothetical protein